MKTKHSILIFISKLSIYDTWDYDIMDKVYTDLTELLCVKTNHTNVRHNIDAVSQNSKKKTFSWLSSDSSSSVVIILEVP